MSCFLVVLALATSMAGFAGVVPTAVFADPAQVLRVGQHVEAFTYSTDGTGRLLWRLGVITEIVANGAHVKMDDDHELHTIPARNIRAIGPAPARGSVAPQDRSAPNGASAIEAYRRSVEMRPTADGYAQLAALYERAGKPALAADAYENQAALLAGGARPADRGRVGAAAELAIANRPKPPAPPKAGDTIALGAYDCVGATTGMSMGGQARMTIAAPGLYVDHLGGRGTYTYDPVQRVIWFHGGVSDGARASYSPGPPRPSISLLSPSNRVSFTCDHA